MMDMKTKDALEKSILKWKNIVDDKEIDRGDVNCPLCHKFGVRDCEGCPVFTVSGERCEGTYDDWTDHHHAVHSDFYYGGKKVRCAECKELAVKQLEFLESLREGKNG